MARRGDSGNLFIGRVSKNARAKDLEDVFGHYGRMIRCEIKYGPDMAFAFIDYEDRRDAEDALRYENGRSICGNSIVVEWAKGTPRVGGRSDSDECYKCRRTGHMARDCTRGAADPPSRGSGRTRDSRSRSRDRRRSISRDRTRRRSSSRSPRRNGRY